MFTNPRVDRTFGFELGEDPSELEPVTAALAKKEINIQGFASYPKGTKRHVHLFPADVEQTEQTLKALEVPFTKREVVTVSAPNQPGALDALAKRLSETGIKPTSLFPAVVGTEPSICIEVADATKVAEVLKA